MSELIRHKGLPRDLNLWAMSDQHFGARACHVEALREVVEIIRKDPDARWIHNGDSIEGKPTRSKHFDPASLDPKFVTIEQQVKGWNEIIRPIADKCLYYGYGNHDIYLKPDWDIVRSMCDELGMPRGGYQGTCDLGKDMPRIFLYHGRRTMVRGAKDPLQREANQQAWVKRQLEGLFGNAHVMLHGHVHTLHVVPPRQRLALLSRGYSVRARHFVQPVQTVKTTDPATGKVDVREFIPEDSRWYAVTGTFRRSGGPGWIDYAEIGGYEPSLIGCQLIKIRDGAVDDIEPQVI